jgi:uncharacterized membrane-anchored protein
MTMPNLLSSFRRWPRIWIGAIAVALLQTGVLAAMILDRAHHLATGREIVLPVIPVDPRSLFRGDYVILNYDVSTVPAGLLGGAPPHDGERLYVVIGRKPGGDASMWVPLQVSRTRPALVPAEAVVLVGWARGQPIARTDGRGELRLRYGIESYFVPEGAGKDLERRIRTGTMAVIVAVNESGQSAIKGVVLDGVVRYDEPLF